MKTLKKVLGIVMILALVLSVTVAFTACGKNKDGGSSDGGTETPGTETPGTGTETPGTGTETPGAGTETPGTGTETPGTGTETPGTGTETPAPDAGDEDEDEDEILASYYPYTIVVRDDKGNSISGAQVQIVNAAGELGRTITTDASGVVTFQVAPGDWKAQLLSVPAGYVVADYSTKYAFTNYVANIVVAKPAGYIFNAKDDEGAGIEGLTVTLYPDGDFNSEVTYYAETNQYGQAVVDAPAGVYTAVVTQLEEVYYIANIAISYTENKFEYDIVLEGLRGTEGNPSSVNSKDYTAAIPANTAVWFTASYGLGAYIYVADPDVTITYNGNEYEANEGEDFVKVALDAPSRGLGFASFSISAPEANTALAIQIVYPEGHINNPIVTDISIFEQLTAGIEILKPADMGSIDATARYYSWTPDFDGDLVLVCDNAAALINITNNTTSYQATTMEGSVLAVSFSAGDEIIISIAYGETGNGTATITAPTTVYAMYEIGIVGVDGNAIVGANLYIQDANTETVAQLVTDVLGKAIVRLPLGEYKAAAPYVADAGYKCTEEWLSVYDVTTLYIVEYPSTDKDDPTRFALDMVGYAGNYTMFDLVAGKTFYFYVNGNAGQTLRFENVAEGTTISICTVDEDGNWVEVETFTAVMTGPFYMPSYTIDMTIPAAEPGVPPMFVVTNFIITTPAEAEQTQVTASVAPMPGSSFDDSLIAVVGENEAAVVPGGGNPVFYKYEATEAGTLTVTVATVGDTNVAQVELQNWTSCEYRTVAAGGDSIAVSEGDIVYFMVSTSDLSGQTVSLTVTFTPAT